MRAPIRARYKKVKSRIWLKSTLGGPSSLSFCFPCVVPKRISARSFGQSKMSVHQSMASRAETSGAESSDAYPVCESTLSQRHVHCQPPTSAKPPPTSTSAELPPTSTTAKLPPSLPPKSSSPTEHVYQQGMHAFTSARALLRAEVASGLNLQPSLLLFVPMLLASMLTSAFLEHYVREKQSQETWQEVARRQTPRSGLCHMSHPVLVSPHSSPLVFAFVSPCSLYLSHRAFPHSSHAVFAHLPHPAFVHLSYSVFLPCTSHVAPPTPHPTPPLKKNSRWSSLPLRISPSLRSARTLSSPRTLYATT